MPCVWLHVSPLSVDPRSVRWASIDPAVLWAPLRPFFPAPPARILDVGAGSGRDAAWFSRLGYAVTCVEPDRRLWPISADWEADGLPALSGLSGRFDLITISAVWHLLPEHDWSAAFERLADLAKPGARLILSLRLPPMTGADDVAALAQGAGWQLHDVCRRSSLQAGNRTAGVMWDWCVFARVAPA